MELQFAKAFAELESRGLKIASKWLIDQLDFIAETRAEEPLLTKAKMNLLLGAYGETVEILSKVDEDEITRFIKNYARFLKGEQRKKHLGSEVNEELVNIAQELSNLEDNLDAFCLYFRIRLGVVFLNQGKNEMAKTALMDSLKMFPYNWSAWLSLGRCIDSHEMLMGISGELEQLGVMFDFFLLQMSLECYVEVSRISEAFNRLNAIFPTSPCLEGMRAAWLFSCQDYEKSEELFEKLKTKYPCKLDYLDQYALLLYIQSKELELGLLAEHCTQVDPDRPETSFILGNYYSLRGDHELAIQNFFQALDQDQAYNSAWMLIGHEYLELRNTPAAIEAYRRAIELSPRDYRSWHGLAQAYELMRMYEYAAYFYQNAIGLRPHDTRIWFALAECFKAQERQEEALRAYQRALFYAAGQRIEGVQAGENAWGLQALMALADLHASRKGEQAKAAKYYEKIVRYHQAATPREAMDIDEEQVALAALYLAKVETNKHRAAQYAELALELTSKVSFSCDYY